MAITGSLSRTWHNVRVGLVTVCWVVLLSLAFTTWTTTSTSSSTTAKPSNSTALVVPPFLYVNTTLAAQTCTAACGIGAHCNQTQATGVVLACLDCPTGRAGLTTCADITRCTATAWCSSTEAAHLLVLHNALVGLVTRYYNTTHPSVPWTLVPSPPTLYSNWTTISPVLGSTPSAILALLNLYLEGKVTTQASPVLWFDDQAGWWNNRNQSYFDNYQQSLPVAYAAYLPQLKSKGCTRTWLPSPLGTCLPPL